MCAIWVIESWLGEACKNGLKCRATGAPQINWSGRLNSVANSSLLLICSNDVNWVFFSLRLRFQHPKYQSMASKPSSLGAGALAKCNIGVGAILQSYLAIVDEWREAFEYFLFKLKICGTENLRQRQRLF